jgi:hypothetical protein
MKRRALALLPSLLLPLLLLAALPAREGGAVAGGPVVLELFTSEGCPSCPPADALFPKLARMDNVIALSCHVTYWDAPGRKDALSQPFCTQRQHVFALRRNSREVYTPQLVINGRSAMIGSDKGAIRSALRGAAGDGVLPVALRFTADGRISAALPAVRGSAGFTPEIVLLGYGADAAGGRPANLMQKLGTAGAARTLTIDPPAAGDGYILLVQDGPGGAILAAGELRADAARGIESGTAL